MSTNASWFGFRLHFLNDSDQDTAALVLGRGLIGLTVEVTRTDGTVIPCAKLVDAGVFQDGEIINAANLGSMQFVVLDEHGDATSAPDALIRYEDIAAIGVY